MPLVDFDAEPVREALERAKRKGRKHERLCDDGPVTDPDFAWLERCRLQIGVECDCGWRHTSTTVRVLTIKI